MLVIITLTLAVVQEMCARLGAATGRGLLDLVRERFGIGWALFAVVVVLVANGGVIITEFLGIGAAAELFGISRYLAVPLAALAGVVPGHRRQLPSVEKIFLVMALAFLSLSGRGRAGPSGRGRGGQGHVHPDRSRPTRSTCRCSWR